MKRDFRTAKLDAPTRALLEYAEKLTLRPQEMTRDDVKSLRRAGFPDEAVLDAAEIAGFFNMYNRIADGLGVDLEPEMKSPKSTVHGPLSRKGDSPGPGTSSSRRRSTSRR